MQGASIVARRGGRIVVMACALLGGMAWSSAPAWGQISIWEWFFPPTVSMICPTNCSGFRPCKQTEITVCNRSGRCICKKAPSDIIPANPVVSLL